MTNPPSIPAATAPDTRLMGPIRLPAAARRRADWRPEIQGLRAVAVLLVVVFHIFTDRVSGGVDIFLFISAFFLTGSFTRKMESGRPLAVGRYWLHVFTRLMPMAVLTILTTLVAVATVYPLADRASWRTEALASALYVEKLGPGVSMPSTTTPPTTPRCPPSSISGRCRSRGRCFILWPLLFLVSALVARRTGARPRAVLTTAFASVFVVSLLWSVTQTSQNQAFTYFDTRAPPMGVRPRFPPRACPSIPSPGTAHTGVPRLGRAREHDRRRRRGGRPGRLPRLDRRCGR
ncbi:acyltransferase family protein [Micrococcus luteus]|uniref:acyltransferase family protein n=1 Tax=Micrococcus luteus TaxID=1270 RepID=UPI0035D8B83F